MAGDHSDASSAKRKRDESHERRAPATSTKERRVKVRQEHMEDEFAQTFQGITALYKTLEMKNLHSPLFLPRTLGYRLDPNWKKGATSIAKPPAMKIEEERRGAATLAAAGANMKGLKVGMTSDTLDAFKAANQQMGLLVSMYTAQGRIFAENQFSLLATCLIPARVSKDVQLPREFLRPQADMCVLVFQLLEIGDQADSLAHSTSLAFQEAPKTEDGAIPCVSGKDLLTAKSNGRTPLFANLLSLNVARRRVGYFVVDLPPIGSSVHRGVKCQFRMTWEPLPKAKKVARLAKICEAKLLIDDVKEDGTFVLDIPKRDIAADPTRKPCQGVWFHFLYHLNFRRMSEKRSEYSCAWCSMYAGSLRGLVAHLVASHDRFRFQATVGHDNIPHIYVTAGESDAQHQASASPRSVLCELELNSTGEPNRFEQPFEYVNEKKYGLQTVDSGSSSSGEGIEDIMQEFDEMDELSQEQPEEFYAPLLQRQYFHSRTGAVVLDHEKDYDSDDDVDESWIVKQSERLLDEFEDVSLEEKEFMKKWNRHVKEFPILADFMVASSCRMFARNHGRWLLDHGLRHNFLLHLLNLWDNSLLNSRAIIDCMVIVDHCSEENAGTGVKEAEASVETLTSVAAQYSRRESWTS